MNSPAVLSYKPSAFYFRAELRLAKTREEAIQVGLHICRELEELKAWVRGQGMIPPKWNITRSELVAKQWGELVPLQSLAGSAPDWDS